MWLVGSLWPNSNNGREVLQLRVGLLNGAEAKSVERTRTPTVAEFCYSCGPNLDLLWPNSNNGREVLQLRVGLLNGAEAKSVERTRTPTVAEFCYSCGPNLDL